MNDPGDSETGEAGGAANRYLIGAVIAFALLALPSTRFQPLFRMAVWTTTLFGAGFSAVRPLVNDFVGRVVVGAVCLSHFVLMSLLFPHLDDGYLGVGLTLIAEIVVFSIPIGWLVVRSRRANLDPRD